MSPIPWIVRITDQLQDRASLECISEILLIGHRNLADSIRAQPGSSHEASLVPASLVLFEGVPGSGKTTASRALAARYRRAGLDPGWALEEDRHHPFFGAAVGASHRAADFPEICLNSWHEVMDACGKQPWILEGVAFQSTVRFMFEQAIPESRIVQYWARFADLISDVDTLLILLRPPDVATFVREHTMVVRSEVWDKMTAHVRTTPVAQVLDAAEGDLPVVFWARYSELCDRLLEGTDIPLLTIDLAQGWSGVDAIVAQRAGL